MKSLNDKDKKAFRDLASQADVVKLELDDIVQRLAAARRNFFQNPSDEFKGKMTELEEKGVAASDRLKDIINNMGALLKLTAEEIEEIETAGEVGDSPPRYSRDQLTADQVAPTGGDIDTLLSQSVDKLLELIPASTLTTYRSLTSDSPCIKRENGLLSIVKGVVPESEYPQIHRFAQCINESHFWLTNNPNYDVFAGASLIPQIARLAERLDVLSEVPGAMKRIRSLWRGSSRDVDSTIFELLVAAGCAIKGRSVEFLEPGGGKTPDLRCHDPYPIVIECKRKRVLTEYELSEERVMRSLFEKLDTYARAAGMWGVFLLELSIESKLASIDEIVSCLLQLRFSGNRGSKATWPWGTAAYVESAKLVDIRGNTRMYSPFMLNEVFGWNSDLAEWDGLICRVRNFYEPAVDMAEEPVGLLWVNSSEQAIKKRSWGPMSTLNEAIEQVPPGEFGIPFVAYQEGARSAIADIRTLNLAAWLKECCHPANIRVPFGRIFRLYPRPLQHGAPDFIESSISFVADYGDNVLPSLFPANVIVH